MLYEKILKSQEDADINLWRECLHDDWEFLMHSSGKFTGRAAEILMIGQKCKSP